jgi:HK97 family phage portal protein
MKKAGIFRRVISAITKKSVRIFSSVRMLSNGAEDFLDWTNLSSFKDSLYLFIGVSMIRDTISSTPLELYQIKNSDGDVEYISDDPIVDLFNRPNSRQTKMEFWKLAVSYYLLSGDSFWYLERENEKQVPRAMVNMRPDAVEIALSADTKEPIGYSFTKANGSIITLAPWEVLHTKNIDPTNPIRGVGVVRPATYRIIAEKEAANYQLRSFKNQGRPDIAVFLDEDLDDEKIADAREKWKKAYEGDNQSRVGFFGSNAKEVKLLSVTPKEMEGRDTLHFLRDDILAALRIPKQMIDPDVNYNNSVVAYANYIRNACEPILDAFIDVINNKLLSDFLTDKFFIYETDVGEDREIKLKEATELKREGIISVNEAREIMNYPEVEGGDIRETSSSPFQLSIKRARAKRQAMSVIKNRAYLRNKFSANKALKDLFIITDGVARQRNSVFNTPELKDWYIKVFNENIDRKAETFKDAVDIYNNDLLGRIKNNFETIGVTVDNFINVGNELREARNIFLPIMQNMFKRAGQDTMDTIANGFSEKASEQFYTPEDVLRELELRAEFFIGSMIDTDFNELRYIISQGLSDGLGVEEIGRTLRQYFDDMSVARARTIARTETGRLVSLATNEAYRQSAFVTGKEWLTARDDRVRPEHQVNDRKIVAVDGVFPNGESYPGEKSINCRCAIAPAI